MGTKCFKDAGHDTRLDTFDKKRRNSVRPTMYAAGSSTLLSCTCGSDPEQELLCICDTQEENTVSFPVKRRVIQPPRASNVLYWSTNAA